MAQQAIAVQLIEQRSKTGGDPVRQQKRPGKPLRQPARRVPAF
jgi:hypothetical protein